MVESWNKSWKTFFVTEDTVEDKRFPGKMKRMAFNLGNFGK